MGEYVFIFCFCLFIYLLHVLIKEKKAKKILEIITLIVMIIFSGTRYRLGGYDYSIYESIYNNAPMLSNYTFNTVNVYGTDIIYILFNSFIKTLGFSFYGFTLIESIIFHILLYKAIKKYNINFGFFIMVFLYKLFIFNTFVSMRQSIVLVIFFNAVQYLINGNKVKYLLITLLCTLIHSSAIILLPLVFIEKLNFNKKTLILYCFIFFVLFLINIFGIYEFNPKWLIESIFVNNEMILGKIDSYFTTPNSINILSTIECYVIVILLVTCFDKLYNNSTKEQKIIINLFLIVIPIVTLFRSIEIMIRIRDYFYLFMPFVLYYICNCFHGRDKLLIITLVIVICFIGFYRYVYSYGGLVPYVSYITENVSIFNKNN